MGIILPLVVASAGGLAFWRVKKHQYGKMTPARKKIFEEALKSMTEPSKLRSLANTYEKYGLRAEALELRKRAALREAPQELKVKRTEAFQKALSSTDPQKVSAVADAFHKIGAYGAASKLKKYATGLVPDDAPIGPGGVQKPLSPLEQRIMDKQEPVKKA